MRLRVTIRGEGVEIRGYTTIEALASLTSAPGEQPYMVIASPAEDDYDPFKEQDLRELHHFETEQINARVAAEAKSHADALEDNWEQGDLAGAVNSAIEFLRGLDE